MKLETWECDICKAQRKESNHWFKAFIASTDSNNGVVILPWNATTGMLARKSASLEEFTLESADAHLCGANCVTEWLSRNLLS